MEMRLNKAVAKGSGLSRRKADEVIQYGHVKVNGRKVNDPATKVNIEKDHIKLNGKILNFNTGLVYFMVNKPVGYLSTVSDDRGRDTVVSLVPKIMGLFPVGRLDMDTRGLILITNDGDFANHISHPSNEVEKVYIIKTDRDLTEDEIYDIQEGRNRGGGKKGAVSFSRIGKFKYKISLIEGAKRQIRNIFAKLDVKVNDLKRTSIGSLVMKDVPEGCYRPLTRKEIDSLLK